MEKVRKVLTRLKGTGLKVNLKKSFFAKGELEYLGYWITRQGIKPLEKKVEAIKKIAPPTNRKQLRSFIGIINYYRDMWPKRSEYLAPLSRLVSTKVPFKWGKQEQKAFDVVKKHVARETLLSYPDFNKPFEVHTDASDTQLGAIISQNRKPIAFYSKKLTDTQKRYTTTEKELLSIVETFKNLEISYWVNV